MVQPIAVNSTISAAAPSLNVYKKAAVIRLPSDSLTYEDADGNQKSVSIQELGDAISSAVSSTALNYWFLSITKL
jgi:hypothetical protein